MTSKSSTSGLTSLYTEKNCKLPKSSKEEMSEHKDIESIAVFTKQQELRLLKQIEKDKQSICICKSCSINKMTNLVYQIAKKKELDAKFALKKTEWNCQLESKWQKEFAKRHKDEISKFPLNCKALIPLSQPSTSNRPIQSEILTFDEEQLYLTQIREMEIRYSCICKKCIMSEVPSRAYKIARNSKSCYPKSWDTDEMADSDWMSEFLLRNRNIIPKSSYACEWETFQTLRDRQTDGKIISEYEEQLLLTQLQEMETQHSCKCKRCLMKEMSILAYILASDLNLSYPHSWKKEKQANTRWINTFKKKYKDKISKFSSTCKRQDSIVSQTSTSRHMVLRVLTDDTELLLLIVLEEIISRHGCNCKNCLMKEVPTLVYKIARDLKKSYPKWWDIEKQAGKWWMQKFEKRHKDKISKLSSVCKKKIFWVSTFEIFELDGRILSRQEERSLLLAYMQEVKTRSGCKCKNCLMKEVTALAYILACKQNRLHDRRFWDRDMEAGQVWLKSFKKRHQDIISVYL